MISVGLYKVFPTLSGRLCSVFVEASASKFRGRFFGKKSRGTLANFIAKDSKHCELLVHKQVLTKHGIIISEESMYHSCNVTWNLWTATLQCVPYNLCNLYTPYHVITAVFRVITWCSRLVSDINSAMNHDWALPRNTPTIAGLPRAR